MIIPERYGHRNPPIVLRPSEPLDWPFCRWLQAENPTQAVVDVVHEGDGELPDCGVEVGLVEGDQGGDADDPT